MNGTEPRNRVRGRGRWESPCALGSAGQQDSAGSPERKLVGIKFRGGRRSGPVLRQKTERAPGTDGSGSWA